MVSGFNQGSSIGQYQLLSDYLSTCHNLINARGIVPTPITNLSNFQERDEKDWEVLPSFTRNTK